MKNGNVNVLRWFSVHSYSCCCHVYTAAHHVLLSDMYSSCSRKTAAVVGCVQQENSCYCRMCAGGKQLLLSDVYSRKTAIIVGCVQEENSYCQMRTARKQLLFSGVYSRKIATVVRSVHQENSYCLQVCTLRKRATLVRCVQQENNYCCHMCAAVHPSQKPVHLFDSLFTCIAVSVYLSILSTCLDISNDLPLSISVTPYSTIPV
jgi:hypothetical protein